jgi:hypothetical protein
MTRLVNNIKIVGFEVLIVVVMKTADFWVIAPCSPYMNRCFITSIFRVENQPSKKPTGAGG